LAAARSVALRARGFEAVSRAAARTPRLVNTSTRGTRPQTHIGTLGGHTHVALASRKNALTMRSSSEW
jgi:hypothetical protein